MHDLHLPCSLKLVAFFFFKWLSLNPLTHVGILKLPRGLRVRALYKLNKLLLLMELLQTYMELK